MFGVGDLVVCTDNKKTGGRKWNHPASMPVVGKTYTIADGPFRTKQGPCIRLVEIQNWSEKKPNHDLGYLARRFAPARKDKGKTDISVFQKMLEPEKV